MIKNICSVIGLKLMHKKQDGFWTKLVKEDTNVSVMNFFLMATLGVGVLLLFIPVDNSHCIVEASPHYRMLLTSCSD